MVTSGLDLFHRWPRYTLDRVLPLRIRGWDLGQVGGGVASFGVCCTVRRSSNGTFRLFCWSLRRRHRCLGLFFHFLYFELGRVFRGRPRRWWCRVDFWRLILNLGGCSCRCSCVLFLRSRHSFNCWGRRFRGLRDLVRLRCARGVSGLGRLVLRYHLRLGGRHPFGRRIFGRDVGADRQTEVVHRWCVFWGRHQAGLLRH
ncbi:uncharacterized protein B0I36DRAFT_330391 [Microdochium trichocladiopsis]|uniref:Uncharacterized protein n=1 Tax=Microdochium trichocladiopsis TaxID=1682393 RepID=A0A9P9BQX4_9PEZI|nr:uncharacterized protein B0I36DRAFT_330391 [Microdochium trichocladiopsis]KAH7026322.1 hypothetical protein B0I36DRAFT_330391 [Microdochium trichocladiopsis]